MAKLDQDAGLTAERRKSPIKEKKADRGMDDTFRIAMNNMKCRFINFLLMATGLLSFETAAQGVSDATSSAKEPVTVIPGAHYRAGGLHKFFFGSGYRKVWTTPVKVPVLDLENFAGGLTPTRRGGGLQTLNLRFQGGDGREYAFRSADKDPSRALPGNCKARLSKASAKIKLVFSCLLALWWQASSQINSGCCIRNRSMLSYPEMKSWENISKLLAAS
ncbi:MAG: hypothetical protein ACRENG_16795 [bacterium]